MARASATRWRWADASHAVGKMHHHQVEPSTRQSKLRRRRPASAVATLRRTCGRARSRGTCQIAPVRQRQDSVPSMVISRVRPHEAGGVEQRRLAGAGRPGVRNSPARVERDVVERQETIRLPDGGFDLPGMITLFRCGRRASPWEAGASDPPSRLGRATYWMRFLSPPGRPAYSRPTRPGSSAPAAAFSASVGLRQDLRRKLRPRTPWRWTGRNGHHLGNAPGSRRRCWRRASARGDSSSPRIATQPKPHAV